MTLMPNIKGKYDAWNRLIEVRNTGDVLIAQYEYNALNQRIKKTVSSVVIQSFFNENWQELESKTGAELTTYIWGLRYVDDLILREKATEKLYSIADPNWNVVAICDNTGDIQERYTYNAFGKRNVLNNIFVAQIESAYNWNRAFTGQVLDNETGLMLYRNRYYHVELGRFVNRDPIGYDAGDENLYRYITNCPLSRMDVHGLQDTMFTRSCDRYYGSSDWVNKAREEVAKQDKIIQEIRDKLEACLQKKGICGEKANDIREKLNNLINKATTTKGYPVIRQDDCWKWADKVTNGLTITPDVFIFRAVSWDYMFYTRFLKNKSKEWILDHAAIEVTICNNDIYYFDDGWWGGSKHVFKPERIPWEFVEPGLDNIPATKPPQPLPPRPERSPLPILFIYVVPMTM
jgi:RHS repeat-associated protein